MAFTLAGKIALVTGASKGIGAATARLFGALGATVAVHYKLDTVGARNVVDGITAKGGRAHAFAADLTAWDAGAGLVRDVESKLGVVDVAVLNHGIWKGAPIDTMGAAEYDEMFDHNVRGVFSVAGAVVDRLKASKKGGSLVLIASTAGQRGEAGHSHYAATKGALISLTKSLSSELAGIGIRVNCVAPGWVATPMTVATLDDPAERAKVLATIPMGRVGEPDEIASAVAFVASDAASFITGEILNVNGGAVLCG